MLTNTKITDRNHTSDIVKETGILSVNQLNAQTKLTETWKSLNVVKYPLKFTLQNQSNYATRSSSEASRLKFAAKTVRACSSFMGDCPKIWNAAPAEVKSAKTIYSAKLAIKKFIKSLPVLHIQYIQ